MIHCRAPCDCAILVLTNSLPSFIVILNSTSMKPNLDPSDPSSYRPVSNVSFLSKFVERIANRQLEQYFSNNGLLPAIQSGFRRSHSTETAVLKVYNDTVLASDEGEVTVLILLDYSAAFDTVDHGILLSILEKSFGVTGTAWTGYDHSWLDVFKSSRSGQTNPAP